MGLKDLKEQSGLLSMLVDIHGHVFLELLSLVFWFLCDAYHYPLSLHKAGLGVCQGEILIILLKLHFIQYS